MLKSFNPTTPQIERILIAGILWGLIEIFISKFLKIFQPALFSVLLPFVVSFYIIIVKRLIPLAGSVFYMGILAAVLKFFYTGMEVHGPFWAIIIEALCAEFIFVVLGLKIVADILVGVVLELFSAFYPLISKGMLCNSIHLIKFKRWLATVTSVSVDSIPRETVISLYLSFHLFFGFLAGILAFMLFKILKKIKKSG